MSLKRAIRNARRGSNYEIGRGPVERDAPPAEPEPTPTLALPVPKEAIEFAIAHSCHERSR